MGDTPESNMETDVSSTTGDVPDSRQVPETSSDMDTVEVYVQLKDELNSSNTEKSSANVQLTENESTTRSEILLQNNKSQLGSSPEKAKVTTNIESVKPKSPSIKEISNVAVNKSDNEEPQSETIDSSSNFELQPSTDDGKIEIPTESTSTSIKSPTKQIEPEKSSPSKEVELLGSTDVKQPSKDQEKLIVNDKVDSTESNKKEENMETDNITNNVEASTEIEASNDSAKDSNTDPSEKEHNKSISRELKSLIKSAKESKIINECTQVTTKMRKSRTPLDTSLNASVDAEKIQGQRRLSSNSQQSNSSEASEKVMKRSMRSQNPEFVIKVKQFLNSVTGKVQKETEAGPHSDEESPSKSTQPQIEVANLTPKQKKMREELPIQNDGRLRTDPFCWRCHWGVEQESNDKGHNPMRCTVCPRSLHYKCLSLPERSKIVPDTNWVCPECRLIMQAESSEARSPAMKKMSLGMLCELLTYALDRMKDLNGVEPFTQPVDRTVFPDYDKYVVHPMDLTLMRNNIKNGLYGSTEAFHADVQWILHNSVIFNTTQSKLTSSARALLRSCKTEMGEIEACPECYSAANSRKPTWFIDVCSTPHILLWAKLKGFPYWPAKGMTVNSSGLVDVRFFGAHDRAWVPSKDCFLYSEKDPNNFRAKRQDIIDSMQEAEQHIRNISRKYGKFVYPPFRTQFEPNNLTEQLKMMIPNYEPEISTTSNVKSTSASASPKPVKRFKLSSKGSKNSVNGETNEKDANASQSEVNDSRTESTNTTQDGNKSIDVDEVESSSSAAKKRRKSAPQVSVETTKDNEKSRKRRRSQLEEAILTVIETEPREKRKKVEDKSNDNKKADTPDVKKTVLAEKQQKSTENESTTPKSKPSKESPNVKKSTVTYVSKTPKINPLKIVISTKAKTPKSSTPKSTPDKTVQKDKNKSMDQDKAKDKQDTPKLKQKKSKSVDEATKNEQKTDSPITPKHSGKGISVPVRIISKPNSVASPNQDKTSANKTDTQKSKDKREDDTTLAELARESAKKLGLPTISSVRSLSDTAVNSTEKRNTPKTIEITVEAPSNSSVFTPTSTDSVKTSSEAANKLQRLRGKEPEPGSLVGKVGVRAFARMKSTGDNDVQVEVKSEPIDVDLDLDADRQTEKMDLMNAFQLRPVNPPVNPVVSSLRDIRITKVTTVTTQANAKKPTAKMPELRPRAKKSFPQPKKPDEGRSELNSKNSMVYIPIQPPQSQAPVRPQRTIFPNGPIVTTPARSLTSTNTISSASSIVNTVTPPLVSSSLPSSLSSSAVVPHTMLSSSPNIGQVPTNVHTVPLLTTMNGQWTISLQPIMSVGGVDNTSTAPLVNGVPDRSGPAQSIVPIAPNLLSNQNILSPNQNLLQSNQNLLQSNQNLIPSNQNLLPSNQNLLPSNQNLLPSNQNMLSGSTNNQNLLSNTGTNQNILQGTTMNQMIAPNLLTTDTATSEMCRIPRTIIPMQQDVPPPATAGPVTSKLAKNANKLTDLFRSLLEDAIDKVDDPKAMVTALKLQLENATWRHKREIDEIKHNNDLLLAEMKLSLEKEKSCALAELRRTMQAEIDVVKLKQWCAQCRKEAQFYCCWNAAYCDEACQRAHWTSHYSECEQTNNKSNNSKDISKEPASRLQPKPNISQKTPMKTVGGKVVQDKSNAQKSAVIMSMVEDTNGNQSMKCVGYKHVKQQNPPLLINKQLMANDESSKKVATSGGYLIVGTGAPNSPLVTQTLRPFYSN